MFDALTALTTLDLRGNGALACLPVIPASVTTLQLDKAKGAYDVCGAALTLGASSVTVTRDTTATYTVVLAEPPTGDVTVTPASSATAKVTVSGALTFTTGNWNSTQTVTLTGVAAGTATISHTTGGGGYDDASAGSVTAKVPETDLCIRTSLVRDAVVAAVSGKTTCGAITPADLAGMTTLSVTNESALSTLKSGDFAGLTGLTTLTLSSNGLASLPAGVFDKLTELTTLALGSNALSSLPAGVFDKLTKLTTLTLSDNALSGLPAGVFDNLTRLTTLSLLANSLSSLPAGVFDKLTELTTLTLDGNALSSLPAGVFDKLTKLTTLTLSGNGLSSLPAGMFDNLTRLNMLVLSNNALSSLPAGVFDNLTKLTVLDLSYNALSSLPAGVFDNLTELTMLYLNHNSLDSLRAGVFDNLDSLMALYLDGNASVTCLPYIPSQAFWTCPSCTPPDGPSSDFAACGAAVTVFPTEVTMPRDATALYTVVLEAYPRGDVLVAPASGATAIATVPDDGALTFTTDNWNMPQTVMVTGVARGETTISHTVGGGGYDDTTAADVKATVTETGEATGPGGPGTGPGGPGTGPGGPGTGTGDGCDCKPSLSAGDVGLTRATLTLADHDAAWWIKGEQSGASCKAMAAGATVTRPSGLVPGTAYTYTAYADDGCTDELATTTFTTLDADLTLRRVTLVEGSTAQYTISLTQAPTGDVTVTVSNPDEGAVTVSPVVLAFTPGNWNTAQPVTLNAVHDPDTADETVTLTHTASGGGYTGESTTFTTIATVTDDDVPALILSPASTRLVEGGETAVYTVALATLPTAPVTVTVSNPDEGAVTASPAVLAFTPGNWSTAQPVRLGAVQDPDAIHEMVTLAHTASGGGYDGVGADFIATVTDDDVPALILSPASATLAEGGEAILYTVALTMPPTAPVTVTVGNPDQGAVTAGPAVLTFTPGNWSSAQPVRLRAVQDPDAIDEAVTLAHAASGGGYDGVGADFAAAVTDDDAPALILSPASATVTEGGDATTWTVALAIPPTAPVTVTVSNPDEGAVTASPAVLRFTPGNWNTAQPVRLVAVQDPDAVDETVTIAHTASGGGYDGVGADFAATVMDDDVPALILSPASATLVEGGEAMTWTVALATLPTAPVTVTLGNPDEGAVTVSPTVLMFTPGDWHTAQTVTVSAVQDPDTLDETVTLAHTAFGGGYDGVGADFTATVKDDGVPALILSPPSATLAEGGNAIAWTVALATLPTAPVTVTVGNPDEGAVTASPVALRFTPGDWNTAQPVTLGAVQDLDTLDETVTLAHTASGGGYDGVGADFTATVKDDDVPALILSPTSATLAEGGDAIAWTVALATPPTAPVTVTVSNPDEEAVRVSPVVLTFTPDDWHRAQTVRLGAVQDPDALDETVTLAHTASGGGYDGVGADFIATVKDGDAPALILSPTSATLAEGGEVATWTVALTMPPTAPVTVTVSNPDEEAVTASPVVLRFTPGDWNAAQTVTLGAVQDPDTFDETVTLAHAAFGGGYDGVGADFTATVTDDDVPALILSPASATLAEGGEAATWTVVLATLPTAPVTVTLGNPDEEAVTVSPAALMFTPGNWNTVQTVTLGAVQDPDTFDETVTLAHAAFGGGYDGVGADFTATVTDDDVPALILSPASATLAEDGEAATWTVALATLPTAPVTVTLSNPDQGAVTASPVVLTFTPGNWNAAQTVTLGAVQDPDTFDETVTLAHTAVGGGYDGVGADFTATVTDDDVPALILSPPSATLAEGGEAATWTVALATLPTAPVTVTLGNPDEEAVTVSPVALTFTPSDWNAAQTVTLGAVQDPDTLDETVTLAHTASGGGYDGVGADFTATVTDDDVPALILSPASATLAEGGEAATWTVVLATLPTAPVTVTPGNPDEEAVTVSPVALTFTPGNWNTAQTVTLGAVQDPDTLDETVTLAHTASGGGYDGVGADFTATVTDDDIPALILSPASATLAEGGEAATWTVALATLPTAPVTVTLGNPDQGAVTVSPVVLTFTPGNWNTAQAVTLGAVQDPDTFDETVTLAHTAVGGGYDGVGADFTATVTDDDVPALILSPASATVTEGGDATAWTVALATLPTAPVTVTLGNPDEEAVTVSPVVLTFTPSDWNTAQPVTLDAVPDTDLRDETVTIAHTAGGGDHDGVAADFTAVVSEGARASPGDESFVVGETTVTIVTRGDPPRVLVLLADPLASNGTTLFDVTVTFESGDAAAVTGNGFRLAPADAPVVVDLDVTPVPDGGVTVCLPVPPAALSAASPSALRLLYAEGGVWSGLESTYDPESGMLCARNVRSFGLFAVGRIDVRPPVADGHRLKREILARVGQTLLEGAVDAVTERVDSLMSGACEPNDTYELGGYAVGGGSLDLSAPPRTGEPAWYEPAFHDTPALEDDTIDTSQLLGGSSFRVSLGAAEDVEDCVKSPRVTLWGKGRYWHLGGSGEGALSWSGDLLGARLGIDLWAHERWLTGLTLGWADGTFDWTAGNDRGAYGIALTSLHPYAGWRSHDGHLWLWGTLGYGLGELDLASTSVRRNLQMTSAAAGLVRGAGDQHHAAAGRHDDAARQG